MRDTDKFSPSDKDGTIHSRRRVLGGGIRILSVLFAGGFLYSAFRFVAPGQTSRKRYLAQLGADASAATLSGDEDQTSIEIPVDSIAPGSSKIMAVGRTPVIVVNGADGLVAFNATCTHLGCLVKWEEATGEFVCPCHAGRYDKQGSPIYGPPPLPLKKCTVTQEGATATVSIF